VYKVPEEDHPPTDSASYETYNLIDGIVDIQFSQNLIVIKTRLGHATGVAFEIDRLKIPEIIGTVGGDDTLLVVLKEGTRRDTILQYLRDRKMLPQQKDE